jgi:hypothetical protein
MSVMMLVALVYKTWIILRGMIAGLDFGSKTIAADKDNLKCEAEFNGGFNSTLDYRGRMKRSSSAEKMLAIAYRTNWPRAPCTRTAAY